MRIMCFGQIHPPFPPIHFLLYCPHVLFFPVFKSCLFKFNPPCYMVVHGCWTIFYSTGSLSEAIFLNQTNSCPFSIHQLTICHQLEGNFMSLSPIGTDIVAFLIFLTDLIHTVTVAMSSCMQWCCHF